MDLLTAVPETPAILIDKQKARDNCINIANEINKFDCIWRPHAKTHKMVEFSKLQLECGAEGICCAKVSEAEVMANGGIRDIFIAYPLIGDFRIKRAAELSKKIHLVLTVDSATGSKILSDWAKKLGVVFEVIIEIDTQFKRTGVKREDALELAKYVSSLQNIKLIGISTFRSLTYDGKKTDNAKLAGEQEGKMLVETASSIRDAGIDIDVVSGGSTPTGKYVASVPGVTEVRTGTNIFNDYAVISEGACTIDQIAAFLIVSVVSTPESGFAVIDGGSKALATDYPQKGKNGTLEYAFCKDRPNLIVNRIYEEHGIIVNQNGNTGLEIGERIALIPAHICSTINLYNYVYVLDNGKIRKVKVDARGMLI